MKTRRQAALVAALSLLLASASAASAQTTPPGLSAEAEYLRWWFKDSPAPTPLVSSGALPAGEVLLGGDDIDTGGHNGVRLTLGYRFGPERRWGLEASGFMVDSGLERRAVSSSGEVGSAALVIPFFDVTLPGENTTNLSLPGTFAGSAVESLETRYLGGELNGTMAVVSQPMWNLDALAGVRYLQLREQYRFDTSSPGVPPGIVDIFKTRDQFTTENHFIGPQLGVRGEVRFWRLQLGATAKVAFGAMVQDAEVEGELAANTFAGGVGDPATFPGGYFAQPTNIGEYSRTRFAVVPEATVKLGLRVTDWMTVFVGYTLVYISEVARAGDQVNRNINPTQSPSFGGAVPASLVGPAAPTFQFRDSDFWSQGVNAGIAVRF
jgi:hypothetical protein